MSLSIRSFATSSQSCYTTYGLPVSKNGPVKQAITSIERSYLFLVGGNSFFSLE
ncbi:hypothetical protein [Yersinia enterocolitica]|uniref:hypothetical protein n=1 Tax=Yersinia enterocolitica TaxID=630 RepID=UPI0038BCF407|nr:hypothetical protein [Yersinia enterocolitica]